MNVRATAAVLALLFTTTTSVLAAAESPSTTLRVAVVLEAQPDNAAKEQRLLEGLANGLVYAYGRKVRVVDAASAPDAVANVAYRCSSGDRGTSWAFVVARVDGRALNVTVRAGGNERQQLASWQAAGGRLGQDIGQVLKLRKAPIPPATLEGIVARLADRDAAKRALAANQAAHLGTQTKAAIPALLDVLGDVRPLHTIGSGLPTTPSQQATKALIELGAHTELIAFVRSKADDEARAHALVAIAIGRSPESADVILQALDDRSGKVRASAAGLAGAYVGRRAAPRLIEILAQDRATEMRAAARRSLAVVAGEDFNLDADAWRQWWAAQERRQ